MKSYCMQLLAWTFSLSVVASCKKEDPGKEYRFMGTLPVDGLQRTWLVNLPPTYYEQEAPLPLVIGLHGTGGSAEQFERDYGFPRKAGQAGYIMVYPDGVRSDGPLGIRTWNAGYCCDYAADHQVNDVGYISRLLDSMQRRFHIDPKRVYVAGMSNGAMMAYRLAAALPDRIAAIAPVSGPVVATEPVPTGRPVPVLHIHSALDTKIPYAGGIGIGGYYYPPVDSVLQVWAARNQCSTTPATIKDDAYYRLREWTGCAGNTIIRCYLTQDGGHAWPGGQRSGRWGDMPSTALDATSLILDFFSQYALP